jgi:hypothetical protein
MQIESILNLQWLWGLIPFTIICLVIVIKMIFRLVKTQKKGALVSVPLDEKQEIAIDATGPMLLHGEGPLYNNAFANLDFQLTSLSNNNDVFLSNVFFKSSAPSFSKSRQSLRFFEIEQADVFQLKILGLESSPPVEHQVIITLDHRRQMAGSIVVLVFAAIGLMLSFGSSLTIYIYNLS